MVTMPTNTELRGLRCFCGAVFATVDSLNSHAAIKGHRYRCACGKVFKDVHYVKNHCDQLGCMVHQYTELCIDGKRENLPYCELCDKGFKNANGLKQHIWDKHQSCPTCDQVFATTHQLTGHQKAAGHCFCHEHGLAFDCNTELRAHKLKQPHVTGFECLICDCSFDTQQGLDDHLDNQNHPKVDTPEYSAAAEAAKAAVEEANLYCDACDRFFVRLEAYRQHKDSTKHKPLSNLQCPLSTGCGKTFTSPSALVLHLESGGCASGMNRLKLNAVVHQHDTARHITYKENAPAAISAAASVASVTSKMSSMSLSSTGSGVLIATPDESDTMSVTSEGSGVVLTPSAMTSRSRASSVGGVILTASGTSQALSEWSYITNSNGITPAATSAAGSTTDTITHNNPDGTWPCTICDRSFKKKGHLLDHLNSPAHAPKLFHCPAALVGSHAGKKDKTFKTLSGMAQHIEIGACGAKGALEFIVGIFESKIKAATGKDVKLLCPSA